MMTASPPMKHDRLVIDEPVGGKRVVHDPATRKYFRIGVREAAFLDSLDGQSTAEELRRCNRGGFTPAEVDHLLDFFENHRLLAGPETPTVARGARRRLLDFLTGPDRWRIHLVDPDRFLTRHRKTIDRLFTPWALGIYLLILMSPFVMPVSTSALMSLSVADLGPAQWTALYAGMLLVIALHELAHAVTCKHFGGQVHRIGLMLLYLQPVVYCDVSDSWRFADRDKRIAVSVAGCFFQLLLSCVLYVAWALLHVELLAIFAFVNLGIAVMNLVPFVKLDGYWIAVHLFDEPNLRAKSVTAAMRLLTGTPRPALEAGFLPVFGLLSLLATALFWGLGLYSAHRLAAKVHPWLGTAVLSVLLPWAVYRLGGWARAQFAARRELQGARP